MRLLVPRWFTAVLVLAIAASSLRAQTWIGNGASGSIFDSGNWLGGTAPGGVSGTEDLIFGDVTGAQTTVLIPNSGFHNLTFTSATRPAYTFGGLVGTATLSLNGNLTVSNAGADVTFGAPVSFSLASGAHTFAMSGNIGQGAIINGDIGGAGSLTKTGQGRLTLHGVNTYTGGTTVQDGEIYINGGSITHGSANFTIGTAATTAAYVYVSNGADVTAATTTLGNIASTYGYISVFGSGTTWTSNTYMYVGTTGTGVLDIYSGGVVAAPNISIGNNTGGDGNVTIDGAGSQLNASNTLYLGSAGEGNVYVQNGAAINASTVSMGNNAGGDGFLSLDNFSTLTNSGAFLLGNASTGLVTMSVNSTLTSNTMTLGVLAGINGQLAAVDDSQVNLTGDLIIGLNGTGTFSLSGGADATTTAKVRVGKQSGSQGFLMLSGLGTSLTVGDDLRLGENGTGLLFIFDSANLTVGGGTGVVQLGGSGGVGEIYVGYDGEGYFDPGILNIGSIDTGSGTGSLYLAPDTTAASPYYLTRTGLSGGANIAVTGATQVITLNGATVMSGTNTYTGGTFVNYGSILIAGSNSALGLGGVFVDGGDLRLAPGVTLSNTLTFGGSGGILSGSGTFNTPVTIGAFESISPGNSPGILSFTSGLTLAGGASLMIDVQAATGASGTGYDLINVSTAVLNITATSGSPVTIYLTSLNGSSAPGLVADFVSSNPYAWTIVNSTAGITGFAANKFVIDTSAFQNSLGVGAFFVSQSGNSIVVNFTPVPEPSTLALTGIGLAAFTVRLLRRRKA